MLVDICHDWRVSGIDTSMPGMFVFPLFRCWNCLQALSAPWSAVFYE